MVQIHLHILTTVDLIRLGINSHIRHNMTLWVFYLTSQCIFTRGNFDVTLLVTSIWILDSYSLSKFIFSRADRRGRIYTLTGIMSPCTLSRIHITNMYYCRAIYVVKYGKEKKCDENFNLLNTRFDKQFSNNSNKKCCILLPFSALHFKI
jgi:hypothetical protein